MRVSRLASALGALGVRKDHCVGCLGLNSDRYIEYLYATLWAGGVINPCNVRWTATELAYALNDCDTRVLFVEHAFRDVLKQLLSLPTRLEAVVFLDGCTDNGRRADTSCYDYESLLASHEALTDQGRRGGAAAALLYTGGTTGSPKGVMLSHDNLMHNALGSLAVTPRLFDVKALHAAPLFHVGGISFVMQIAMRLGCHVLMPYFDTSAALAVIERERITEMFLVPTMIRRLLDEPDFRSRDISSLQSLIYGASPIDITLQERLLKAMPAVGLTQMYGQTEAGPVISALPPEYHRGTSSAVGKIGSAGRPIPMVEVRILDPTGQELPAGSVGEICARSEGVMLGYLNQPQMTAQALREGWLHTGDVGFLDDDGFLHVVDRAKDMIITGGENVYSAEVEQALLKHEAVASCAVIAVPDADWGERVHAVVVIRPGSTVDAQTLIAHSRNLIATYKCPRSIEFRAELPLSAAGKILKQELRSPHWQHIQRQVG